jgi:hypothetical protein
MRRIVYALGFALALATPAAAQQARTFAPSHLEAAREYLEAVHVQQLAAAGVEVSLEQQIRANPAMEPYRAAMKEWARELFGSAEAKTAFAELYAEAFSEADLRALTTFFRTPLGQRVAEIQPKLAERGAEVGRKLAEAHQADLVARLERVKPAP